MGTGLLAPPCPAMATSLEPTWGREVTCHQGLDGLGSGIMTEACSCRWQGSRGRQQRQGVKSAGAKPPELLYDP